MKIESRKPSDLKPYEKNPRRNDQALDAVAASIKEFGFRQPIVVDEAGVIVVGHTRWKAAMKLRLKSVPVHVATGLTSTQIKAYRIADNRVADLSEWDERLLIDEIEDLDSASFDLDFLGFGNNLSVENEDGGRSVDGERLHVNPDVSVCLCLSIEDLKIFETAMASTEEINRANAIMKIIRKWMAEIG